MLTLFKTLKIPKRLRTFYYVQLYQAFVANFDYEPVYVCIIIGSATSSLPCEYNVFRAMHLKQMYYVNSGPGSSVGIATELRAGRSGDRMPVVSRFSASVQTGPGALAASCTMDTGSFPGVKSGRGVKLTPHPLLVPWSRKSRIIPLLPLWVLLGGNQVNNTINISVGMYIVGQRDYMFRPVEAIIRSSSFDAFKSSLYNYVWRV